MKKQKKPVKAQVKEVTVTEAKGRPMLHWVGKKALTRLPVFPAQIVENFVPKGTEKDEPSLLFHGDNKEVLSWLLANGYRGKVDLIYIDPPFDSSADYVRKVKLRGRKEKLEGELQSVLEQVQYSDIWAQDNYLQFMYERLLLLSELLSSKGSIFLHCDWRKVHHLRCLMDEIFSPSNIRNEIIWDCGRMGEAHKSLPTAHNTILHYSKTSDWIWKAPRVPYADSLLNSLQKDEKGYFYTRGKMGREMADWEIAEGKGLKSYIIPGEGKSAEDIWSDMGSYSSAEYPTQKPLKLLERIIKMSSEKDSIVLDCFIGGGTTAIAAQNLGRKWIACDINKGAIQTTGKRLQKTIKKQIEEEQGKTVAPEMKPASRSFAVYRVNDYDLQIQHNEALELAVEHIGITRTKEDSFFEGTLGQRLVKIVPLQHPCTLLDLQLIQDELKKRKEERDIVIVCLGKETTVDSKVEIWNKLHPINKLSVIELRTDRKYGKFFEHKPCKASVKIERKGKKLMVEIKDFLSPTIMERLKNDAGISSPKIEDWRSMVDCVQIDTDYNGKIFNIHHSDVPEKKTDLVEGKYALELSHEKKRTVAVKITDMLGEELLTTKDI